MAEVFHSLNMRSQRGSLFTLKKQNVVLWLAALGSFVATTLVCEVPFLREAFSLAEVSFTEYGIAIGIGLLVIPIVEIVKLVQRLLGKKNSK
jgi:Ca2+-transporting ATPase